MTAISMRGVGVTLEGTDVLAGFDLEVASGELVGIVGPNGAGKTTALRAIAGGVNHSGDITVLGVPTTRSPRSDLARLVALLPQRPAIPPDMTVIDYVLLGRTPHLGYFSIEGPADIAAAREALLALELSAMARRPLGTLSGGELQRVVLARALAQAAPILLLDEPTSALDVGHAQHVLELVDELRRSRGLTVIAAIHDLTLAAQFCDRLVMISRGQIVAEGTPQSVLTEGSILAHYGAVVRIIDDGVGGVVVIPSRDSRTAKGDASMAAGT
ncbi:MAG: ABC transporter ATP-binding protein [Acidimicrobiia bacterium]|nr:ABC transporter ATP-binding protein [Acidimicrobiia bacterium]MDH4309123.1 ABC transporter ATP-binding protein [Acidimicrobiia bacterium]